MLLLKLNLTLLTNDHRRECVDKVKHLINKLQVACHICICVKVVKVWFLLGPGIRFHQI